MSGRQIAFDPIINIEFRKDLIPTLHPNGMKVIFYDDQDKIIYEATYYSTGGGFIASAEQLSSPLRVT